MEQLLSAAGRSFIRAFIGSMLILAPGVLAAPNLNEATALGIAALIASGAASLKAIQVFIPQISFVPWLGSPYGDLADSFTRTFASTLVVALIGIFEMPDLSLWKAAVTAALSGAVTAGVRAVQGYLTPGDYPKPETGIRLTDPPAETRAEAARATRRANP